MTDVVAKKSIRIALFVPFLNAGETTRALEIAKAIRQQSDGSIDICFFSGVYGSQDATSISYEDLIEKAGFPVKRLGTGFDRREWKKLLQNEHQGTQFIDSHLYARMVDMIQFSIQELQDYKPTIVVHGMSPDGSLASKILSIPNINFQPHPWDKEWIKINMLDDIPDRNCCLNLIPKAFRRALLRRLAFSGAAFKQPTLSRAGVACGWKPEDDGGIFDMVSAYESIIVDLPRNYENDELPSNYSVVGPVFCHSAEVTDKTILENALPDKVREILRPEAPNKVFLSMGSSGETEYICRAVQAVCGGTATRKFHAVVLINKTICSVRDVQDYLAAAKQEVPNHVYLTDAFLPAHIIQSMVDVSIIHGGQGTVQTCMASGTPALGVAFQGEQLWNLENALDRRGAGIRLTKAQWTVKNIRAALDRILENESFRAGAKKIQQETESFNGARTAAQKIIDFGISRCDGNPPRSASTETS